MPFTVVKLDAGRWTYFAGGEPIESFDTHREAFQAAVASRYALDEEAAEGAARLAFGSAE